MYMHASIYVIFDVHTYYQRVKNETTDAFLGWDILFGCCWCSFCLVAICIYHNIYILCIYIYRSLKINDAHQIHFFLPLYLNEYQLKQLK